MKVFIYDKKESKCLNVITEVTVCSEVKEYNQLLICTKKDTYIYNTKLVKTRIYQN